MTELTPYTQELVQAFVLGLIMAMFYRLATKQRR